MKIRSGFVSNSSSSSFLIYGTPISYNMAEELARIINETLNEDVDNSYYAEYVETLLEKKNIKDIDFIWGEDNRNYFGVSWSAVGDNETGFEFKQSIIRAVESIFENSPEEIKKEFRFNTYNECWYNG